MRMALVAGETSGDLLGAGLIRALAKRRSDIRFEGVAGPAMVAAGCEALANAEELAVMGLIEPLRRIPRLLQLRRSLVQRWTDQPPDVFIGIDAPDFNLGLESRLRAAKIKTVHYVSPSVWAWRQGRISKIAKAANCVLCLLPFEKAFYDRHHVAAEFVGHPMADRTPVAPDMLSARSELGVTGERVVAVLPGSRHSEVSRLGQVFADACRMLADRYEQLQFVAPMATTALRKTFAMQLKNAGMTERFLLVDGNADAVIEAADIALVASGTASLQVALMKKPMVGAYRLAPLTYAIAKGCGLVKVPYFTLPNLLTETPLVPEFLQRAANATELSNAVAALLDDPARCRHIAEQFAALRSTLARNADERAADAVLEVANR
ncbi:MAG: lipid-A-disaccharide synthase [Woeseiaceae bacterium]